MKTMFLTTLLFVQVFFAQSVFATGTAASAPLTQAEKNQILASMPNVGAIFGFLSAMMSAKEFQNISKFIEKEGGVDLQAFLKLRAKGEKMFLNGHEIALSSGKIDYNSVTYYVDLSKGMDVNFENIYKRMKLQRPTASILFNLLIPTVFAGDSAQEDADFRSAYNKFHLLANSLVFLAYAKTQSAKDEDFKKSAAVGIVTGGAAESSGKAAAPSDSRRRFGSVEDVLNEVESLTCDTKNNQLSGKMADGTTVIVKPGPEPYSFWTFLTTGKKVPNYKVRPEKYGYVSPKNGSWLKKQLGAPVDIEVTAQNGKTKKFEQENSLAVPFAVLMGRICPAEANGKKYIHGKSIQGDSLWLDEKTWEPQPAFVRVQDPFGAK